MAVDPELWAKQLHPDDVDRALETHRLSNSTASQYLDEYRIRTKDGRTLWIHDEAWPVLAEDGSILFWRGVMLDITDRKEAEDKLRWSLEVLRRTLQQRRELAQRLQHAQEAERRQIAADIHDDPIQVMSAVDMRLQMLAGFPDSITTEAISEVEQEVAAVDRAAPLAAVRAASDGARSRRARLGAPVVRRAHGESVTGGRSRCSTSSTTSPTPTWRPCSIASRRRRS